MYCTKLAKLLTTHKNTSTILNEKLKFATLPFITDIPQAVAFLVFLGIASSIRESMSASDKYQTLSQPKPWCNDSGVLNLHHGYYTTIMTSR